MNRRQAWHTALNEQIGQLFAAEGIHPQVAIEAAEVASLLGLVGAGAGIAIVPATVGRQRGRYIVLRPLSDRGAKVELFFLLPDQPAPAASRLSKLLTGGR